MNYIILDMEWNQPYGGTKLVQNPVVLHGEIIQIGAIKADENFNYLDKIKLSVRPKYYKHMNPHVEKITGITSTQLMLGETFPQAFKRFSTWCGEKFRFITWGFDDLGVLSDNLSLHGLDSSFGSDYINLQLIYNKQVDSEHLQCGLSTAAESMNIPIDVQVHDALNDAYLTFEICQKLDMTLGLAEYAMYSAAVPVPLFKDAVSNVDMKQVIYDRRVMDMKCPLCLKERDKFVKLRYREWIFGNAKSCRTIGKCAECGSEFVVRLKGSKRAENNYTVVRSISNASPDDIASYENKLKKREERKKKNTERISAGKSREKQTGSSAEVQSENSES